MWAAGEVDIFSFPALNASLGIHEIELADDCMQPDEASLARLQEAVKAAGSTVSQLTLNLTGHTGLYGETEEARRTHVAEVLQWVQIARRFGTSLVRVDLGGRQAGFMEGTRQVIRSFKELVPQCAAAGITLTIENHWGLSGSAENIVRIIEEVGSPALRACPDFANFDEGVDRYAELAKLAPYAAQVHAKTLCLDEQGKETRFDFPRCVRIFQEAGYSGAWSMEFDGEHGQCPLDEVSGVRASKALLERCLGEGK
jgi:L-ribulose-5-phosphate 3-epimerase